MPPRPAAAVRRRRRVARGATPFARAARYPRPAAAAAGVGEAGPADAGAPPSERLLHCVWYDPRLRPAGLRTSGGERIRVEQPGAWNLEPGPDFLGAVLAVGPAERRIRGDVEIHLRPPEWIEHGHARDPRYAGVRVHVTYAGGELPDAALPPGAVQIALREALAAQPGFSFENIDPTAYPYGPRAPIAPCAVELARWTADEKCALLDAAGEERLRRKSDRFAAASRERGAAQVFYEDAMSALGYRHNKAAFRRLADAVPLARLREVADGDAVRAYALLAGAAGLLPAAPAEGWDAETRAFWRAAWDHWWRLRDRWAAAASGLEWRLAGLRPANRPERRLMAAAALFTREATPDAALLDLAARRPGAFAAGALRRLACARAPYWDRRLAWGGARTPRPVALLGADRTAALFVNAVVPLLAASGAGAPFARDLLDALPAEQQSGLARLAAHTLFGSPHPASWHRTGLRRQGLLQIFHDYCLADRSRCAECPFPALLRARP